jgi:carbonic anhydrase
VELNVQQSAKDVLLNSPIIKKHVKDGDLTVIQAVYHLETGEVTRLN